MPTPKLTFAEKYVSRVEHQNLQNAFNKEKLRLIEERDTLKKNLQTQDSQVALLIRRVSDAPFLSRLRYLFTGRLG